MSEDSGKFIQFWQELKRRKVIRVIAMYAATAFIIMEAVDIMLPRLGLPDWTVTFIIILLIVGFPITIILSWIFDITPDGVRKTSSIDAISEDGKVPLPVKRGLKTSDLIIVVLFSAVCILIYPKIFKGDKFESIRDADGRISVAVMPFQNMTNDTLWNIWQIGIQNELITHLSNSDELAVRQFQTMSEIFQNNSELYSSSLTPSLASEISNKLQANSFILGSIKTSGTRMRINAQIIDTESGEIFKTFQIEESNIDDIFILTDSLARLIRSFLEIKVLEKDVDYFYRSYATKNSADAYRLYIQGLNSFISTDYSNAAKYFNNALEIDSNFAIVRVMLIFSYGNNGEHEKAKQILQSAYVDIEDVPNPLQFGLEYLKASYDKDPEGSIKWMELFVKYDPQAGISWYQVGFDYYLMHQFEKATQYFEKALEIDRQRDGGFKWPPFYATPAWVYHKLGNHKREKEIYELGSRIIPNERRFIRGQAICALSQGDTLVANSLIQKFRSIVVGLGLGAWALVMESEIYEEAGHLVQAESTLRNAYESEPQNAAVMNKLARFLIKYDINVEEGMDLMAKVFDAGIEEWEYTYTKGIGLFKQGKLEDAKKALHDSWESRPKYYHEHYLLLQEVDQVAAK